LTDNATRKRGRPRSADAATERVVVRVTPAQRLDLRRVASDSRTGVSGIVREAIDEYVSDFRDRRIFGRTTK
jgi:hypothetical protein